MKIILGEKNRFLLLTASLLFYATNNVYAEPQLSPIATVNLGDPPPPWEARPQQDAISSVASTSTDIDTNATKQNQANSVPSSKVLILEDDAPENVQSLIPADETIGANAAQSSASAGIAAWYRNRQHSQASSNDFLTLEQQAKEGDINAQYQLGLLYYSGTTERPQNTQTAIQWLSSAAEAGNSDAQYSLGLLYANDPSMTENKALAQKWLNASAQHGHIAAQMALMDYNNFSNLSNQTTQASDAIPIASPSASALQEQPQEEIRVASITAPPRTEQRRVHRPVGIKNANQRLNLSHLKQDAYAGDRRSQLLLGSLYEDGKQGLGKNLPEAAKWYRKAAEQGYPQAQYNLGLLYEDGKGMTRNYHKATQWYQRAAKKGLSEAQNNLAVLYILGKGVAKDRSRAETLFRRAAKQGNRNAIRNLNLLLEKS